VAHLRRVPAAARHGGALAVHRSAVEARYGVRLRAALPDVLDFNLLPALQREFGGDNGGWAALRDSGNLTRETHRLRRALATMEVHAFRYALPEQPGADRAEVDGGAQWQGGAALLRARAGQTHFPGTEATGAEDAPDPAAVCDAAARADDFLECLRVQFGVDGFGDVGGGDTSAASTGGGSTAQWDAGRTAGAARRGGAGAVLARWPRRQRAGQRTPSLGQRDAAETRRLQREGPPTPRALAWARRLEGCLTSDAAGASVWRWHDEGRATTQCRQVGREAVAAADPIVGLYSPWVEVETPLRPAAGRAGARLYRGLTVREAGGAAPADRQSDGTDRGHALAIARGAKARAGGVSLTKDPMVAAAFAVGGSAVVACYDWQDLEAAGPVHDFSSDDGARRLAAALPHGGEGRLAATFARADAEVRVDLLPAVRPRLTFGVSAGERASGKKTWLAAAAQPVVDGILDAASACETGAAEPAPRAVHAQSGATGPALRMHWAEAELLASDTTAAMAAMALRLHGLHAFTHACATDGGKGDGPAADGGGGTTERTSFGLVAYSAAAGRVALGGALPPGSTVQDAEMHALLACVRWAAGPAAGGGPPEDRRLYILSDSSTQLGQVEMALRSAGPRELRGVQRRGALEEFTGLRIALGKVVTQFVRSHEGVGPNAHADTVATAFMRAPIADVLPRRAVGMLDFRLDDGGDAPAAAVPADRAVRQLALQRTQAWVVRHLAATGSSGQRLPSRAEGLVDWAVLRGGESGLWTALLRRTSRGGSADGSNGRASDVGAVMMVRAAQFGLLAAADGAAADDAGDDATLLALRGAWQGGGAARAGGGFAALQVCLAELRGAVGQAADAQRAAFHAAVRLGEAALRRAAEGAAALAGDGRAAAALLGGMLPEPSHQEWRATEVAAAAADPALLAGVDPIRVRGRAADVAAGAVKCAAKAVERTLRGGGIPTAGVGSWLDDDEANDDIDGTEVDAAARAAVGLDEQVDEEEHFAQRRGGGSAADSGDESGDGGGGGSGGSGGGVGAGAARGGAASGGPGDGRADTAGDGGDGTNGGRGDGSCASCSGGDSQGAAEERDDRESTDDDDDDPDWTPPQRARPRQRRWHSARTAGRIGQVALLRLRHGYARPPGESTERLLRGDAVQWAQGLGGEAAASEARLRHALLGWTPGVPVPAKEDLGRDEPLEPQRADAGAAPPDAGSAADAPPPPWEEGGDLASEGEMLAGAGVAPR